MDVNLINVKNRTFCTEYVYFQLQFQDVSICDNVPIFRVTANQIHITNLQLAAGELPAKSDDARTMHLITSVVILL